MRMGPPQPSYQTQFLCTFKPSFRRITGGAAITRAFVKGKLLIMKSFRGLVSMVDWWYAHGTPSTILSNAVFMYFQTEFSSNNWRSRHHQGVCKRKTTYNEELSGVGVHGRLVVCAWD